MTREPPVSCPTERRAPARARGRRTNVGGLKLEERGYHARLRIEHETRAGEVPAFFGPDGAARSSKSVKHNTPRWLVQAVLEALGLQAFDVDPCAPSDGGGHVLAKRTMVEADDGLTGAWTGVVFVNPPYARNVTRRWVTRCRQAWETGEAQLVVALLPARTGAGWWHDAVFRGGADALFLRGRLKFGDKADSAPFDSAIAVWGGTDKVAVALERAFPDAWMARNTHKREVAA